MRNESESGGEVLATLSIESDRAEEALLSVLDNRRRNGKDGIRYVGNKAGGDGIDGKGGMTGTRSCWHKVTRCYCMSDINRKQMKRCHIPRELQKIGVVNLWTVQSQSSLSPTL